MSQSKNSKNNQIMVNTPPELNQIQSWISELGNKKEDTCQNAFKSLQEMGEPAIKPLVEALSHPIEKVRWESIKLLGEMKVDWTPYADNRTINSLIGDLSSRNGMERVRARQGLVNIGSRSVEALIQAFSSKEEVKRWEAAKALSQIGDPSATEALINALTDKNFDIRWLAAEGLISIGEPALVSVLHVLFHNPESEWLKEGVHHYLHDINNEKLNKVIRPILKALEGSESQLTVPLATEAALKTLTGNEKISK